jgi:hypothetical protein
MGRMVTAPTSESTGQSGCFKRKMAAPGGGAAKFREETPRKGGGVANEVRNAALQQ